MDAIHKIVMFCATPLTVGLTLLLAGLVRGGWRMRKVRPVDRWTKGLLIASFAWFWLWSTPLMTRMIGLPLERAYPPQLAEAMPEADAIVLLGGGMGADTNACPYAEMWLNADRVWHAARLYRAGKAPKITLSGGGVRESTTPLLKDFGVPEDSLLYFEDAKNTEDEARMIAAELASGCSRGASSTDAVPRVLLVTSAWHMRRAQWLFERVGLEVVPAATDYEVTVRYYGAKSFGVGDFLPDAGNLMMNAYLFKEHFAYWCYRVLK